MSEDEQHARRWGAVEEQAELLAEGHYGAAIDGLLEVIAADEENEYAHFFLGQAYYEREAYEQGLRCYVRALELAPKYLGAMIGAGHSLRMLGQSERAIRMGRQALLVAPDDPDALYLLGVVHFQRGDRHAATEYLEKFLTTRPDAEMVAEVRGLLQALAGDVVPSEDDDA